MRFVMWSVLSFALPATAPASAHPGHYEPGPEASIDELKQAAVGVVEMLIKEGKLDDTWKGLSPESPLAEDFMGVQCWLVKVSNPKAADKDKRTLYVFFTEQGVPLGANFTGSGAP